MKIRSAVLTLAIVGVCASWLAAQTPVLSSVDAPYGALQGQVTLAGTTYPSGAVAYGPAGTPLLLMGTNFGSSGTIQFVSYKNGTSDPGFSVQVTATLWTPTMLTVTVPSGAKSGLIKVTSAVGTSNGLPFMVTQGTYVGNCPLSPPSNQLKIVTASLPDGKVGQGYSTTVSASGGSGSYSWSLAGGSLPSGLSLSQGGTISGTPSTAGGPNTLTIRATDNSTAQTIDAALDLTVLTQGLVYSYCVPGPGNTNPNPQCTQTNSGFDAVGNIVSHRDSVNGNWSFGYDGLNRLTSGTPSTGSYEGQNFCWSYDSFGNRTAQSMQSAACTGTPQATASYNANNQVTWAQNVAASGFQYDASGNVTYDGRNAYLYDGEGRICAVSSTVNGSTFMTGYLYDADGTRVAKGTVQNMSSCDPVANGFQSTAEYVLGPGGEQVTELGVSAGQGMTWQHTNVWAGGKLVATYDGDGLHFYLDDPLGTRRAQTDFNGNLEQSCQSLPYGDGETCGPTPTEHLFTGKERDTESGNDYFGARYYASSMGRWLSPDWSAKEEPVPYAKLDDPQTLNLYSYVGNNPLARDDPDGHAFGLDDLVGAVGGAVVGMAAEAVKDVATGQKVTVGAMAGAAVGGAMFGEGLVNAPETGGLSVVAAASARGAAQGLVSNLVQQGVDNIAGNQKGFDVKSAAVSTGLGAVTAGLASKIPGTRVNGITAGKGSMAAVAKAVATKVEKGSASSMSLKTAVKGAVAAQVQGTQRTVTSTYVSTTATAACKANGGCK